MNALRSKKMLIISLIVATLAVGFAEKSFGMSRVLEFGFSVTDNRIYTLDVDSDWEIVELSASGSRDLDGSVVYSVTGDNGDNSYNIDVDQTDVTLTVNDGSPSATTDGSDTMIRQNGRGSVTHELDWDLVLPGMGGDNMYWGTQSDQTGPFISTAVDVGDTWIQTYYVTPFRESQQTVNISCTLLEWTTLGRYNVGIIERTYTKPIHAVDKDNSSRTIDGDLSVTEYWWFSYDDRFLVKRETTETGTLTITSSADPPDDEYEIDVTITTVETVQ